MGRTNIHQTDFLAGEISPRMEMQDNLEGRKHGVELMENFFTHPQGTAETSRGFEFIAEVDGEEGREFGFPVSFLTSFMVVVVDEVMHIMDSYGPVRVIEMIYDGDLDKGETHWDSDSSAGSSANFLPGGVAFSGGHLKVGDASITQQSTMMPINSGTDLTNEMTLVVPAAFGDGPLKIEVGSAEGLFDVLVATSYGGVGESFTGLVSATGYMWVTITLEAGEGDKTISGVHLFDPTGPVVQFPYPSESAAISSMQAHGYPDEDALLITSSEASPHRLRRLSGVWTYQPINLTDAPAEWGAHSYPAAAAFFEGRLWLGGVKNDPPLFWGSKSGAYGTFTLGSLAEDAIESRLDRPGRICWIAGGKNLLIGTSNSEHLISSEGGFLKTGDINSEVQSTNGSLPAQSLEVGNEVMYISPDGRKIRSIGYEWTKDSWRSRDITFASEHITEGDNALTHMTYAANPGSQVVGLTRGGVAVYMTYDTYTQTAGFSRRTVDGTILSVGAVSFGGTDQLWSLFRSDTGRLLVGRERVARNIKLDSYTLFRSYSPINTGVVGHLFGRTCQVLVDGGVHPDVVVSGSGEFELEYYGFEVIIGDPVSSKIKTLPVADNVANVGTTRPMKKRMVEIGVKILSSWRPKINGWRTPNRRADTPMGEGEEARTETVKVANEGWDMDAQIAIEQDLPLPTEVAGWYSRILQEEV